MDSARELIKVYEDAEGVTTAGKVTYGLLIAFAVLGAIAIKLDYPPLAWLAFVAAFASAVLGIGTVLAKTKKAHARFKKNHKDLAAYL